MKRKPKSLPDYGNIYCRMLWLKRVSTKLTTKIMKRKVFQICLSPIGIRFFILFFLSINTSSIFSQSGGASNGNYVIQGASYYSATPGIVTAGKAYLNTYLFGGDVTISGGKSQNPSGTPGTITVGGATCDASYPYGGNVTIAPGIGYNNGKIYLNGATNVNNLLSADAISAGSISTSGGISAGSISTNSITSGNISTSGAITVGGSLNARGVLFFAAINGGLQSAGPNGISIYDNEINVKNGNLYIGHRNTQSTIIQANGGAVGIGCYDTKGYTLAVNGPMIATKVMVKLNADWPDFVFSEKHKIKTLPEIETYIKKNGHLEDVPTAKEVSAKGIDVGEMNTILLKKVEELTLLLIEQNKIIEALKLKWKKLERNRDEKL